MLELTIFVGGLLVLMIIGLPVVVAIGITSFIALAVTSASGLPVELMALRMVQTLNNFTLLAIPLFILAANIMNTGSTTTRIFDFATALVGFTRGGLGHANVVASSIFATMSGTAVADAAGHEWFVSVRDAGGLSIRDYFAAHALAGILAAQSVRVDAARASQPLPTPRIARPFERRSSVAISFATYAGWRCGRIMTPVASRIFFVTAATKASDSSGSGIGTVSDPGIFPEALYG